MTLSPDQQIALERILKWYKHHTQEYPYITLGGTAGTGKTTLIKEIRKALPKIRIAFVSLTGKAVAQMREKIQSILQEDDFLGTIHTLLYKPRLDEEEMVIGWDLRSWNKDEGYDLIINDEASMTSQSIHSDLTSLQIPILYVGDHAQLPPINSNFNLMRRPQIVLETPHRASLENPITLFANEIRQKGTRVLYDSAFYNISTKEGELHLLDKIWRKGNPIGREVKEIISFAEKNSLVIVSTNKMRCEINANHLNGRPEKSPQVGDRLICLRNNYDHGIYNGMFGRVEKILDPDPYFCIRTAGDYSRFFIRDEDEEMTHDLHVAHYPFLNPTPSPPEHGRGYRYGTLWDYAYAITCHKAQGSEANNVVVVGQGFGDKEMRKRWLYTAVTRAKQNLYVVR